MKQFLKYTLATVVGIIITSVLMTLLFFGILGAVAGSAEKTTSLKPNSVYEIKLEGTLVDRSQDDNLSAALAGVLGQDEQQNIGLDDLLSNIKKAKNDPNILGIYLNGGSLEAGIASIKEMRDALVDFKKSGKFIVAYADNYSQRMYYLATVADRILLNPIGMLEFKGLSAQPTFFKGTLDKLGIEMQVVRVGTFKSAVEPFIDTKMSDANRLQVTEFMGSIWKNMLNEISAARHIPTDSLNSYADQMMMFQATEKALQYKMVDKLLYSQSVDSMLKTVAKKLPKGDELVYVTHQEMKNLPNNEKYDKNKVAVIYAVGEISDMGTEGIIEKDMVKTIDDVAKDSAVKAVVLRVNSPGGSAYSSEQIWHALALLKHKKTLIISMGDYAASGGYYISCIGDQILAQPTTITGSIGIFGIIPNIEGLNNKIGISHDVVNTNKMSDAITLNRKFTPAERDLMQNYVNRGYELFVQRCADGRKMTAEQIKNIAEGRVWTGQEAFRIGLVDKLGTLNDAIAIAAKQAKLKSYNVSEYPEKEDFTAKLMKSLGKDVEASFMKAQLGDEQYKLFKQVKDLGKTNGIQARMSYDLNIR
ncbi:MAG: hypothetical protein RIS29_3245 [Bacteroidota bacterium]|jgi:protease-4